MKLALPILLAVALLGGGYLVAQMLDEPSGVAYEDVASQTEVVSLRNQVRALAEGNRRMEDRLAALELKSELPPVTAPAAVPLQLASKAVEDTQAEDVRQLLAAMQDPAQTPEGLETVILEVVAAQEDRVRAERDERREEAWQERLDEQMQEYAEELGLNQYQSTEMRTVLDTERNERTELWTNRRDGGMGRTEMFEAMGKIREDGQTALKGLLLPNQYEQYQAMADEQNGWWGRGGGGSGGNR